MTHFLFHSTVYLKLLAIWILSSCDGGVQDKSPSTLPSPVSGVPTDWDPTADWPSSALTITTVP